MFETDEWIMKLGDIFIYTNYSALNKNNFCHLQQHCQTWSKLFGVKQTRHTQKTQKTLQDLTCKLNLKLNS